MRIAGAQIWVHDQDIALKFYTEQLGMEVRSDATMPELGGFRWLTVAPPGQDDVTVILMAIPGTTDGERVHARRDPLARHQGFRRHGISHH